MPRRARLFLPGMPLHVIQRGNNRQACFFVDEDYRRYLEWLATAARDTDCQVHAYVLMTNHVHLLVSAKSGQGLGTLMKAVGQRYTQHANRTYARTGSLWEGRYRSCPVQDDRYLLTCMRYIELNPIRAGMVDHPARYRWSSYRANAQGEESALIQAHFTYQSLGQCRRTRTERYRELFRHALEPGEVDQIRTATNGNYVLGNERFAAEVANALQKRVSPGKSGRPRKTPAPEQNLDMW